MAEKTKKGFTLSEVLITLVIIGVVAALTIPTAISRYQKRQTVVKLKKAYSALVQSSRRAVADHGSVEGWELGPKTAAGSLSFFSKYMAPYLSLSKEAKTSSDGGWDNTCYILNGTQTQYNTNFLRAYLADGSSITFYIEATENTDKRVRLYIDINGDKKPNKWGRDIFVFYYAINYYGYVGQIIPGGVLRSRSALLRTSDDGGNCNKNESGLRCASVIMADGWEIKDDYPW